MRVSSVEVRLSHMYVYLMMKILSNGFFSPIFFQEAAARLFLVQQRAIEMIQLNPEAIAICLTNESEDVPTIGPQSISNLFSLFGICLICKLIRIVIIFGGFHF